MAWIVEMVSFSSVSKRQRAGAWRKCRALPPLLLQMLQMVGNKGCYRMFRKDLIPMLLERAMTVHEISRLAEQPGKDTVEDIEHLLQSLRHTEFEPVIAVAECRKCGFQFGPDKLRKPSKCPKCKATWITEPRIGLRRRGSS